MSNNFIEDFFKNQQVVQKMMSEADRCAYEKAESESSFADAWANDQPMEYKDIRGK